MAAVLEPRRVYLAYSQPDRAFAERLSRVLLNKLLRLLPIPLQIRWESANIPVGADVWEYALDQVANAYELMASGQCGKVAVCFDEELPNSR